VIFVARGLGRAIALALLGDDVDQHRPFVGVADILEDLDEALDVVAVDGPDIIEAQFLEQSAAGPEAAGIFLPAPGHDVEPLGQLASDLLGEVAKGQIFGRGDEPGEIVREPSDRRRDRHVVVVEDDDQPVAGRLGVVHRLIGHSGRHRAVADHSDRPARAVGELVGDGETEGGGDGGRAVRRPERVVLALRAPGEAGEAAALAEGADAVAAAGQDLVGVGLVADVPDQPVVRSVEDVMERDGELDHAEAGAEMAAGDRHRRDGLGAKLVGELAKLRRLQPAKLGGRAGGVEQRCFRAVGHGRRYGPCRVAPLAQSGRGVE
jgi:hypothetical protein